MSDIYTLLTAELGRERVLRTPEALETYGRDESGLGFFPQRLPSSASRARRSSWCCGWRRSTGFRSPRAGRGAG